MATVYVSQTATNGYAIGNDDNNGSTKALAKLTLEAAITAASSNDTIIINDGTYTAATYFSISKPLTINPENSGMVTLKRTGATTRVAHFVVNGTIVIGELIFDAEDNSGTSGITMGTAAGITNCTLNGTKFINIGASAVGVSLYLATLNLIVNDVYISGRCAAGGMVVGALSAGDVLVNGLEVTNEGTAGSTSSSVGPLKITASATGVHARIRGVKGHWVTGTNNNSFILTSGVRALIEHNRGMVVSGTGTLSALIACTNNAVLADNVVIRYNQGVNQTSGQYLIFIGSEGSTANDNKTNYPHVYKNDMAGTDAATEIHGVIFGSMNGGVCFGNRLRNVGIGVISKLQTEKAYFVDNDIDDMSDGFGGALRTKGTASASFVGNRVRFSSGKSNLFAEVVEDPTIPTASSDVVVIGNSFYSPDLVSTAYTFGNSGTAATGVSFANNYFAPSYGATAFRNGATNYDSVAAWAAFETKPTENIPTSETKDFWRVSYLPLKLSALSVVAPILLPLEY